MRRWRWKWFDRATQSPRFQTGRVVITGGAREALKRSRVSAGELLQRHAVGDWGQVDEVDRKQNELGLRLGLRLRSIYLIQVRRDVALDDAVDRPSCITIWAITAANRAQTTILLPSEIFDDPCNEEARS